MYDPTLGKFISVDPVMDLADPQQWNAYSYSNNNPITWSDPTGLRPMGAGHDGSDDPCAGATSCVKERKGADVRECYTAYACHYYSTHADAYETSGGGAIGLVDRTTSGGFSGIGLIRTGAAAAAHNSQVAAEKAAALARAQAAADKRVQNNMWGDVRSWASAEEGYGGWSGQDVSGVLGDVSVIVGWTTAGTCFLTKWCVAHPVTAAVAAGLLSVSAVAGVSATAIDCVADPRSAGCVIGTLASGAGSMGFAARTFGRLDPVSVEGFELVGNVWGKTMDTVGILERGVNG
jgi:hypothetical protein